MRAEGESEHRDEAGGTAAEHEIRPVVARSAAPAPSTLWRDVIEALTVAIILSLIVKQFAVEAYKVPSGSMEPTIVGDKEDGDRILVNKMAYLTRDPRRYEVVIFRYPNNRAINYIKRVVGLPEETVFVIGGDVYSAPFGSEDDGTPLELHSRGDLRITRKPPSVQEAMFARYPQIPPEAMRDFDAPTFARYWILPQSDLPDRVEWAFSNGAVRAASPNRSVATFRDRILDNRKFDPPGPTNRGGRNVVGDVRVRVVARANAAGGSLVFEIRDWQHSHLLGARIPIEGSGEDGALTFDGQPVVSLGTFRLTVGTPSAVAFTNVDDRISMTVDGETIAAFDYTHPPQRRPPFDPRNGVSFGVEGADVTFTETGVFRDVFYESGFLWRCDVPAGNYFVLGDNSPSSKDSREWVRLCVLRDGRETGICGDSEAILDPGDLSSRTENPWLDEATGHYSFMDEWGNIRDLGPDLNGYEFLQSAAPLVPRETIMGRAFCVFLPLERIKLIR